MTATNTQLSDFLSSHHAPLYLQVQETLQEMIEDVEYGPGDQIPSERELSEMLGVSRMTVRRAIENLIDLGLLERRSTSGTYVREPHVVRHVGTEHPLSLTQLLAQSGAEAGGRLLEYDVVRAPRKVATYLGLRVGEPVVLIRRLRLVNDVPFCIETSYIPRAYVSDLSREDLEQNVSFYNLLRDRYGINLITSDGTVKISRCLQEEADLLELHTGDPVLFMRSVVYDTNGRSVEYLKSVNHPDRVAFRTYRDLEL